VPVRDETVIVDGLRLHYRDWGHPAAPPLLLLHGGSLHARTWDIFAGAMVDRFRLLALDLRGHGESEWATDYTIERFVSDIADFVDQLRLDRFSLVGNSIGGRHGCVYAARRPDRVERLVMLESCLWPPLQPDAQAGLDALRALPATYADLDEAVAAYHPLAPRAPGDVLRRWVADGLQAGSDGRLVWRMEEIEVGSAVHLPLEQLQFVDLTLGLAIAPLQ
jgi:pimeloyl-ACP methyl ester carboxylesterase